MATIASRGHTRALGSGCDERHMMAKEPIAKVVERRGRPRNAEPGSTLSIWLRASEHEHYAKLAERRGQTVSSTVAALLRVKWKHSRDFEK